MDSDALTEPRPARVPDVLAGLLFAALVTTLVVAGVALGPVPHASALSVQSAEQVQAYPALAPDSYEKRVQYWVNKMRRRHGLRALRLARCTDDAAERWSGYLARNDLFYHQAMEDLLERCDARYAGETLGRGGITPRRLVRMWMASDGHRHVLLSHKSRRIGVGATPDAYGRWVVAANFMRF